MNFNLKQQNMNFLFYVVNELEYRNFKGIIKSKGKRKLKLEIQQPLKNRNWKMSFKI